LHETFASHDDLLDTLRQLPDDDGDSEDRPWDMRWYKSTQKENGRANNLLLWFRFLLRDKKYSKTLGKDDDISLAQYCHLVKNSK